MAKRAYVRHSAYYGRWRTVDGRRLSRKVGTAGTGALPPVR